MKNIVCSLLFICSTILSHDQNLIEVERELSEAFSRVDYWYHYEAASEEIDQYDSLAKVNTEFQKLLLKYTALYPQTLSYPFKNLVDMGVGIKTSEDGLFRIYSWDTQTGGTMRFHKSVFQYKNALGTFSRASDTNSIGDYENLEEYYYGMNGIDVNGKSYYLVRTITIASSAILYYNIKIFSIENYGLNDTAKLIKTKTGIKNELGYDLDLASGVNRDDPSIDRSMIGINYNAATKTISFPLIAEDGKITSRRINYRFNGKYFVKM